MAIKAISQAWKKVVSKSHSGARYYKYVSMPQALPRGFNHSARRRLDVIDKRKKEGREHYLIIGNTRRYFNEK